MGHWQAPTSKRKFYKHKERRKESYHVCIEMFKLRGKWYVNSKWGLENIQGIEFDNEYKLARELYSKIEKYEKEYSAQVDKPVASEIHENIHEADIQANNKRHAQELADKSVKRLR
jgi:hypothetical protein